MTDIEGVLHACVGINNRCSLDQGPKTGKALEFMVNRL